MSESEKFVKMSVKVLSNAFRSFISILQILLPLVDVSAPGIFRLSGNNTRQLRLIDALRCGQDAKSLEVNSHDIATVVKQVLREYPGRLFDSSTESTLSRLVKENSEIILPHMQDILKSLSADRISLLNLVMPFMHKVAKNSEVNKMDASNLARVVALDFFPDICNPAGTDSTLVRQIIDWRIKIVEKLIVFGDKLVQSTSAPKTPIAQASSSASVTPIFSKSAATTSITTADASQKRKRPPQSPLKAVWNGFANIFSKTPRPGRPESTPPNGTPSFFSKFSNRLCPSGKKAKHEEDEAHEVNECTSGYRSDDNSLRCPPVKQNLRNRFSHKKKSPKVTTPSRLKTPSTPFAVTSNYGTFSTSISRCPPDQVRTELFDFTAQSATTESAPKEEQKQLSQPFIFSSQQNLSYQSSSAVPVVLPPLSPVNISPDIQSLSENVLLSNDSSSKDAYSTSEDAMETATMDTDISCSRPSTSTTLPIVILAEPSPSISHLSEEMRDSLSDLLNIGVTPRCRLPVTERLHVFSEPVVETTFDSKEEAERRFIVQVKQKLGPAGQSSAPAGSRRPSVANLERMGQVSQGRRLWEQGGPCTSSLSTHSMTAFNMVNGRSDADNPSLFQASYPRLPAVTKRQTDL